jgi:DNA-binding PadR family transcriptional regulator
MQHEKLAPADMDIIGKDRWEDRLNAQNQREQLLEEMGLYSYRALNGWSALTENLEMVLLKQLHKLKSANVYELSQSKNVGHYSTVLRGLRRMEEKKLVFSILKSNEGRHEKIYEVTLLGELFESLAQDGWKGISKRIASLSLKFRDCQLVHELYDPCYHWRLTRLILEKLIQQPNNKPKTDLEQIVADTEFNWIKENIIEKLSEHQSMTEKLDLLERLGSIEWIKPVIIQQIGQYFDEWKIWLKAIDVFRTNLVRHVE